MGKKKEEAKPQTESVQDAVMKVREGQDFLQKRYEHVGKKITQQEEEARTKMKAGDKSGALMALKRKKMHQNELQQLENAKMTLEKQVVHLESARTQQMAVAALQVAVNAQQSLNKQLDLGKVEDLMETMEEQQQIQNEMSQVFVQGNDVSDANLLKELDQMQADEWDYQLLNANTIPTAIPGQAQAVASSAVPTTTQTAVPSVQQQQPSQSATASDEDQLRMLQAELA